MSSVRAGRPDAKPQLVTVRSRGGASALRTRSRSGVPLVRATAPSRLQHARERAFLPRRPAFQARRTGATRGPLPDLSGGMPISKAVVLLATALEQALAGLRYTEIARDVDGRRIVRPLSMARPTAGGSTTAWC
jgi:hypothetical protein